MTVDESAIKIKKYGNFDDDEANFIVLRFHPDSEVQKLQTVPEKNTKAAELSGFAIPDEYYSNQNFQSAVTHLMGLLNAPDFNILTSIDIYIEELAEAVRTPLKLKISDEKKLESTLKAQTIKTTCANDLMDLRKKQKELIERVSKEDELLKTILIGGALKKKAGTVGPNNYAK